ncbi:MAG: DUF3854 domain-containing protein, partial [Elainella sp.]
MSFEHEFTAGSGIARSLYEANIELVADTTVLPGGEVSYPIHEALNWRVTRFGHRARETQQAAIIRNEDGSCFQVKLGSPREDRTKGKSIKYETPVGASGAVFLPAVPEDIRELISARYGVVVPKSGSFWQWLVESEIPIIWTEGAKKALSLLSQGYVAIALYGVNSGYRRLLDSTRELSAGVLPFAADRAHYIAFDQDEKPETRRKVAVATARFGALLPAQVKIIRWSAADGKGADDLLVRNPSLFDIALQDATLLIHWQIEAQLKRALTLPAHLRLHTVDLSLENPEIPEEGIIAISSGKGTGKTKFLARATAEAEKALVATHRIALGRNICSRLGLDWRSDIDRVKGEFITGTGYTLRVGFCVDSLLAIDPAAFTGCDLIVDEVVQVIRHLLTSSTCSRGGKRQALLNRFTELVKAAKRVIVADADLDNATISYLKELRGEDEVFLIRNSYLNVGYQVTFFDSPDRTAITGALLEEVENLPHGKLVFVATDSKTVSKDLLGLLSYQAPEKRVLVINSET